MGDTPLSRVQLQQALADNSVGAITAQTIRNLLASIALSSESSEAISIITGPAQVIITTAQQVLYCDTTSNGSFPILLPSAAGIIGKKLDIKNTGTGNLTINTSNGQTIEGQPAPLVLTGGQAATIRSDNRNWLFF